MPRLTAILTLVVALALQIQSASAEPYKDPSGRFDLSVPAGWTAQKPDDDAHLTVVVLHEEPFRAVCVGIYFEVPQTRKETQQAINDELNGNITTDFWNKALNSSGAADFTIKVESSGIREQSGRKIPYVQYTGTSAKDGEAKSVKGKLELQFVPGSMHFLMCMTGKDDYDVAATDFDAILTSYEPHGDVLVTSNDAIPPSVLTMFAKPTFAGAARVLAADTSNLAVAGWPTTSASLAVDGAEAWQVCESADYKGKCQTIAVAADAKNGRAFVVASARRVSGGSGLPGLTATAIRRAMHTGAARRLLNH